MPAADVKPSQTTPSPVAPLWQRMHVAFMPDYNRKSAIYWWTMTLLGMAALAWSLVGVAALPWQAQIQVLLGTVIAACAGFFPLRVPHSKNSFVAGEIFIFLLLLLQGPEAAAIAAAGEGLVGSWTTSKRWTSRIMSPAVAALSMWLVGSALHLVLSRFESGNQGLVLVATMGFALAHLGATTLAVSIVLRLKRNAALNAREIFHNFTWVGITTAASASVAALLYLSFKQTGVGVLLAGTPILVMLLSTLHYYFRQQETAQTAQKTKIDAAMREAEVAARHMREMAESERRFHSAFTHASIGMALVTVEGRMLQANLALESLLGRDAQALIGRDFGDLVIESDRHLLRPQLERANRRELETVGADLTCKHADGRDVSISLHCSFFSEPDSTAPCLILQVQDITARREAEAKLHHIAFHDGLTSLPNRSRFHLLLEQTIDVCQADPSRRFAVMFIDCDRFKIINDSMGHSVGDQFLIAVARRIQERIRPGDVVARLGGDEFAILLRDIDGSEAVTSLADRLLQAMRLPVMHGNTALTSSVSIGVTFGDAAYTSREEVLRDADIAMYRAKFLGKDRYALFDEGLRAQTAQRVVVEQALRQAVADGSLGVAYQPLFNIRTGELEGFEALCRWQHPTLGAVPPSVFIPMAEEIGAVTEITHLVLSKATMQLAAWQRMHRSFANLQVHVNVSANDIAADLVTRVMRALARSQLRPRHLVIELTENILMENIEGSFEVLAELRQLGVELAIDDFGTGYSSLSSLSRLPITTLKIDASFVRELKPGSKQAEVVRAVVSLGASLGKAVIAEGIETESQMAMLDDMGCEGGQGYLLSQPLGPAEALALLERNLLEVEHGSSRFAGSEFSGFAMTQH